MKELFQKALHIEKPFYVKDINFDEQEKKLEIKIDFEKGATFNYKDATTGVEGTYKAYDTVEKRWRHLNFFEHECYLICRTPRIQTKEEDVRLINPPWVGKGLGFTMLFEALILQMCEKMPINTVAKMIKESDDKIWRVLEKYIEQVLGQADYSKMTVVGMDETSSRKGHKYITLFVDLKERKTVYIAEGKDHKTVESFAKDLKAHKGDPEAITDVSCDMSPAFIKGVKDNFKKAEITFDKFHILKVINEAVNKIRKEEAQNNPLLKGTKYLFLKNAGNLSGKQKTQLDALKISKMNFKSIKALHIRENFQEIYSAENLSVFEMLLKKWYWWATHCRLEPMKEAAYTIKRHWEGIVNWKRSLINNGILEGLNSLIQAAKAKARGFKTFRTFRLIAFLITGKLDFKVVNPSYGAL